MSFVAGNYEEFILELRAEQRLLCNDQIDIENDTAFEIIKEDLLFKSEITKADSDNGIYITIYFEKKEENTMKVELERKMHILHYILYIQIKFHIKFIPL